MRSNEQVTLVSSSLQFKKEKKWFHIIPFEDLKKSSHIELKKKTTTEEEKNSSQRQWNNWKRTLEINEKRNKKLI